MSETRKSKRRTGNHFVLSDISFMTINVLMRPKRPQDSAAEGRSRCSTRKNQGSPAQCESRSRRIHHDELRPTANSFLQNCLAVYLLSVAKKYARSSTSYIRSTLHIYVYFLACCMAILRDWRCFLCSRSSVFWLTDANGKLLESNSTIH